ncbi:DMT family transporter [Variovorax ureilyticus]|uniref:DMT family transporter n=1 Tax=Variovorax ureilyticus TaxID=1836198 RepID=UPI003D66C401
MFAGSDATIKYLGGSIPVLILLWVRYMFQTATMAGWHLLRGGPRKIRSRVPALQCLRGALLLLNSAASFYGVQRLPLAEFTALMLLAPVATTVLSALVLKESVSPARWAMVALGVVGMLAVVRPTGAGALGWGALLPISSALCYAAFQLVTRRIASADDLIVTNFLSALLVTSVLGVVLWALPLDIAPTLRLASGKQWALLLLMGTFATTGHVCMAGAVRVAPLSVLMPFAYAQIVFATAIGWLLFAHAPDLWAVAGICLIGLGGIGTVWLNGRPAIGRL